MPSLLLRRASYGAWTSALRRPARTASLPLSLLPLTHQRAAKGDYGFNVFHNSNPQHGGSYARHERRMRDDEVEDFLKSVKHWVPVFDDVASGDLENNDRDVDSTKQGTSSSAEPPAPSPLRMGEEAIMRTFTFDTYREAYLFMGRVWAFCYGSDKYPHITWEGTSLTVYLYSPSFRGLSKREARVAAFLNDQYNMAKKSKQQQRRIVDGIVHTATVEEMMGETVARALAQRHAARTAPLQEVEEGPSKWRASISADVVAKAEVVGEEEEKDEVKVKGDAAGEGDAASMRSRRRRRHGEDEQEGKR